MVTCRAANDYRYYRAADVPAGVHADPSLLVLGRLEHARAPPICTYLACLVPPKPSGFGE